MATQQTQWEFEAQYIQSCNCDFGCPCNFNGYPTFGNCEALVAYKITQGRYDNTNLGGITFALAAWWPKAIHEGGGKLAYYIDDSASDEQQHALDQICSGKYGGGVFEIFPMMSLEVNLTKRTRIDFNYDSYDSSFTIDGVGEAHSEHIKNPVTGDGLIASITLPNGIAWKQAIVSNIKKWWVNDRDIKLNHENKNGHVCTVKFNNSGCIG